MPPEAGRIRMLVATGCGIGFAPIAPGTFGSIPGVLLAWGLGSVGGPSALALGTAVVAAAGFWAAGAAARRLGAEDPGPVVVDEIAGQMLTLLPVAPTPAALAAGFVVFRILDVLKPFPVRRLESLPGGSGIMADDLAAGVYGAAAMIAATRLFPGVLGS